MTFDQCGAEWTKKNIGIDQAYKLLNQLTTNVAETHNTEEMQPNISLNVFEIDSHHACSKETVQTYPSDVELAFWRRFPKEAWNQNISISHFYRESVWVLENCIAIFFYTQQTNIRDRSLHLNTIASQHGSHYRAAMRRLSDWMILITW